MEQQYNIRHTYGRLLREFEVGKRVNQYGNTNTRNHSAEQTSA
jgi:hypothetical protein